MTITELCFVYTASAERLEREALEYLNGLDDFDLGSKKVYRLIRQRAEAMVGATIYRRCVMDIQKIIDEGG